MKTLDINFYQLLILLGSFQALIFGLIIFCSKKYNTKVNLFLGLMVFFTAMSNLEHMLIDMNYWGADTVLRKIYPPIQWLILPMFYMHVHTVLKKSPVSLAKGILLIAPFCLVLCTHLAWYGYLSQHMTVSEMPDYFEQGHLLYSNLASCVFNTAILIMIYRMITDFIKNPWSRSNSVKKKIQIYRKIILIAMISIMVASGSVLIDMGHTTNTSSIYYPFFILISVFIYWIGYVGINKKEFERGSISKNQPTKRGVGLFNNIHNFMIEEEQYLDTKVTLESIANKFGISPGYLSKLVNMHTEKSFNSYVNEMRVTAAKKLIENQDFQNYTIESIGLESGFKSKSNFYTVFKKFTGSTPNQYRKKKGCPES